MLELHMAQGMNLDWLKTIYDSEKRGFNGYRVEWMKGKKEISITDKIKKKLFGSKILHGGTAIWLPYTPGAINYVNSCGKDVISGPFSGCIMAAYEKKKIGGRRVCHVATSGDKMDCKTLWQEIKNECATCIEFKPMNAYKDSFKKQMKKFNKSIFFGLITSDNRCYTIIVNDTGSEFISYKLIQMHPTVLSV